MQRWHHSINHIDRRTVTHKIPKNKLSLQERAKIIAITNSNEFAHLPPSQIVPRLADQQLYIASESSFYRVLKAEKQLTHRGKSSPRKHHKPPMRSATRANQVWSWDITFLASAVKGLFYYLYLVMDIYSRKIVGFHVDLQQSGEIASELLNDIYQRENINPGDVCLHSDNGGPMKSATLLATLQQLGIMPSFSRPSVSDDNPYSESLFRTIKYCPLYPNKPFNSLQDACNWVNTFVQWYNEEHRHSAIQFVTPGQRHRGEHMAILAAREQLYQQAKINNPIRWAQKVRDWAPTTVVNLNPDKAA